MEAVDADAPHGYDGESTQEFCRPGSPELTKQCNSPDARSNPDGKDQDDGHGQNHTDKEDVASTASSPSVQDEICGLDVFDQTTTIVWKDVDGQERCVKGLILEMHWDRSKNQAFFRLSCSVYLRKAAMNNKRSIYLLIYPENVKSIELQMGPKAPAIMQSHSRLTHALRFATASEPCFIIPKNTIMETKSKSEGLLQSMSSLAEVTDFTIYSTRSLTPERRKQLQVLESTFSAAHPSDRPRVDGYRANIGSLYRGAGGEIVSGKVPSKGDGGLLGDEAGPPSYERLGFSPNHQLSSPGRKRQRSSHSDDGSANTMAELKRIRLHLQHIDSSLASLHRKLDSLGDATREPCKYTLEEREDIQTLFDEKIEEGISKARFDLEDSVERNMSEIATEKLRGAIIEVSGTVKLDLEPA